MDRRLDLQHLIGELASLARSRPDEALRRCRTILAQAPDAVPVLVIAARIERQSGRPDEAERLLRRALDVDPDAGPAHGELGMLAASRGDQLAAAGHFRAWTRSQPRLVDACFNLGLAEERCGRFDAAASAYAQGIDASSDDPIGIRLRLAGVLALAGREPEARGQYVAVLDIDSDNLEAGFGLGLIELAEGDAETALARFRACTDQSPAFADAWQQIFAIRQIADDADPDLRVVRELLDGDTLSPLDRERLSFAAGKALDDLGRFDDAFSDFETANTLKHARLARFDPDAWQTLIDQSLAAGSGPPPDAMGADQPLPVFIVGMPRSGTTLVDQILSAHPMAAGIGEYPFLDGTAATSPARLTDIRDDYLTRLQQTGARIVSNKYPANFRHLPLIWRLIPDARVIHVRRSALDTCLSVYMQDFPIGNLYANSLTDIALYYQQYRRVMDVIGDQAALHVVDYEDLLADQAGVSRRMLAHCGLPWDAGCLDFAANRRAVGTLSRWQVRQPLYRSSVGRWRNYRRQLQPLIEALGDYADVD